MKKLLLALLIVPAALAAELVTWDANPPEDQVTSYRVHVSISPLNPKPWPLLMTVTGTSATNTTAGRFAYYVVAVSASGEADPSAVAWKPGTVKNPRTK